MRATPTLMPMLLAAFAFGMPKAGMAAPPPSTAVFDVAFVNTSLETVSPAETERLHHMDEVLRQSLERSGQYRVISLAPVKDRIVAIRDVHDCNGCEIDLARQAGAQRAVVAWVQKVSNLILNINIRIEDVATGRTLKAGSVDIRGNTNESWDRGLKYLLEEHVFGDRP
jgi:hypothetical protein